MTSIIHIQTTDDIEQAMSEKKAIIFKHSTRCGVSARAIKEVIAFSEQCDDDVSLYQVLVVEQRELSDEITARTNVEHHSPEAIFIKEGEVSGFITHYNIRKDTLTEGIT